MKTKSTVLSLGSLLAALAFILLAVSPVLALPPVINNQTLTIPENSPNGTFTDPSTIFAIDPEKQPLTYDVLPGSTGEGIFQVNNTTGQVTVIDGNALDYETTTSYTLIVKVTDTEFLSDTATITINVGDESDEPPTMGDQLFNVPENSGNNATVGQLAFDDIDVNDTHTFTILSGNGTGLGAFQIDSTGKISVKDTTQLNHETTPQFILTVRIQDEGGAFDTAQITINVTDVNENPVVNDTAFSISEAAANGSNVGTVTATDPEGGALNFARSGTTAFNINSTTGQITVADNNQLDYEADPSMTFVVTVTDPGGKTDNATITVNLTEFNDPPEIEGDGIDDVIVNEGATNKVVNLWSAFRDDEDADNELTFLVQNVDNNALFDADPVISNANGTLTLDFAPNAAGVANITVRAFDQGGEHVDDTFKVDVNDAPVAVGYANVTVNEDASNAQINLYDGFTDDEQPSSALTLRRSSATATPACSRRSISACPTWCSTSPATPMARPTSPSGPPTAAASARRRPST